MRRTFVSLLAVGISGSIGLVYFHHAPVVLGWWCGTAIAFLHFYSLRLGLNKMKKPSDPSSSKKMPGNVRNLFFVRYLVLAASFFLILRLGNDQLGGAAGGFFAFYLAVLIDYLVLLRKTK